MGCPVLEDKILWLRGRGCATAHPSYDRAQPHLSPGLATSISLHLMSCPNSLSTSSLQTDCSQLLILKLNLPTFFWCLRTFNGSPWGKVPTPSLNLKMWRPLARPDLLPLFSLRKPLLSFNFSTRHVAAELSFWDLCLLTSPSGHLSA